MEYYFGLKNWLNQVSERKTSATEEKTYRKLQAFFRMTLVT